jgi:hypothetical protein
MPQADQSVANASFPTVRADINSNLLALFSGSSGTTAPTTTIAYMDWLDTSGVNPIWKKRNAANNAWVTVATIIGNTISFEGTLPSQSGQSGKFLTTNGTVASWGVPPSSTKEIFNSSGTWNKPSVGTVAMVMLWGGGGSGARYDSSAVSCGGGGGGACAVATFQLSDLPSTVTVTIGAGGAAIAAPTEIDGNPGGTSSFGSLLSAYGGGPGTVAAGANGVGGGGGGVRSVGLSGTGGSGYSGATAGGQGGSSVASPAVAEYGGAGGGAYLTAGADALYGGGGGGGAYLGDSSRAGGNSVVGGDGAASQTGTPGSTPGGGGGGTVLTGTNSGAGGAGRCIVYVW